MASKANLEKKQAVIDEIKERTENANSIVLFDYRGITDSEAKELRIKLRESNADYKVYKNTLMARAFHDLDIDFDEATYYVKAVLKEQIQRIRQGLYTKQAKILPTCYTYLTLIKDTECKYIRFHSFHVIGIVYFCSLFFIS